MELGSVEAWLFDRAAYLAVVEYEENKDKDAAVKAEIARLQAEGRNELARRRGRR